jgi:hypothetical protein
MWIPVSLDSTCIEDSAYMSRCFLIEKLNDVDAKVLDSCTAKAMGSAD